MGQLAIVKGMIAGILESEHHPGADPSLPVGGGVRTIVAEYPWEFIAHLHPHERLFVVPDVWVPMSVPYALRPWIVGAAEIFTAVSIYPEPLRRWSVWEAEKYFREQVLPLMPGRENRPANWWQRPRDWALR